MHKFFHCQKLKGFGAKGSRCNSLQRLLLFSTKPTPNFLGEIIEIIEIVLGCQAFNDIAKNAKIIKKPKRQNIKMSKTQKSKKRASPTVP
ncbi:MAG: hypothetical protein MJ002_01980 [Paludibacteraceae bacterium]|nr:hypothetical protein [Paludibacteraceae bacterium]